MFVYWPSVLTTEEYTQSKNQNLYTSTYFTSDKEGSIFKTN